MIIDINGEKPEHISDENWEKLKEFSDEFFTESSLEIKEKENEIILHNSKGY